MAAPPAARDERYMARALALAARGLGRTWPNPSVGAVFVKGGRVVGEGFTAPAGGPHAEIRALRQAGRRAQGADLYVTLEPCSHRGRTGPCVDALLPLGLRRLVVAQVDPNPRVRGRGLRRMRAAGVTVEVGVGAAAAGRLLAGFRQWVTTGRPHVTLKMAASLDGRIATATGDARWISGPAARQFVHRLRNEHDAVLVGAGTVRQDDPALTCRVPGGRDPLRIVVTGRGVSLPLDAQIFAAPPSTWVLAPRGAHATRTRRLRAAGIDVIEVPTRGETLAWPALLRALGARGVTSVLVEGGRSVATGLLRAGVVDRVVWVVAPCFLGGDATASLGDLGVQRVARALRLVVSTVTPCGSDLILDGIVAGGRRAGFAKAPPAR